MWSTYFAVLITSVLLSFTDSHDYTTQSAYQRLLARCIKPETHTFEEHERGCAARYFTKNEIIKGICNKPRLTVVPIMPNDSRTEFYPDYVEVKRCVGTCVRTKSCQPSKKMMKTVQINFINANGQKHCGIVKVEEHVTCMCGCAVTKDHCNPLQKYNSQACMCECKENMEEKGKCEEHGREWNMERCGCFCKGDHMDCSNGMVWVPKLCKCMKVQEV